MDQKKAVLFNLWGVAVSSRPHAVFHKLEELHNLPGGFLSSVASQKDGAMSRAERGETTLSQMIPAFEAECVKEAQVKAVTLPPDWSVGLLLEELREAMMDVRPAVLKTAASLRRSGLLTAVLANHWLDDSPAADGPARLLSLLGGHFDLVLQSCRSGHRVPEASMFSCALQQLGVTSQQALWLDADEDGVKAAEAAGMKAILVDNLDDALNKLANFTGVQAVGAESPPPSCRSDEVSHGYVTIRPGVTTHYVEMGSGPPVLLCHGFPESWFSWRYQIPAVAAAGFRVLALDMKGYGESTAPTDVEEYSQEQLCEDLITFMDRMSIPQVTLIGHDWGGVLVWTMAQFYPERVRAVASLNTPLFPADPSVPPEKKLKDNPLFDYQVYFQTPGVAEAELEKDLERTFKIFFFNSAEAVKRPAISTAGVCARGGLFVLQVVCLCYRRSVCVTGGLFVLQEVCVTGGLSVLQEVCLCYRRSVCVTGGLSVLQEVCLCYRRSVCVTGGLFVLQVVCLCYRRSVCVTGGLFVLQEVCLCYRWSVCVTGGLSVLQEVCLCYRWSDCVTGGLTVLQEVCLCYRRSVCVTGGLSVLQVVCLCYRRSVCVTGGLSVLQEVCLCYMWSVCVTGGLSVLQEVCLCYRRSVCVTGGLSVLQEVCLCYRWSVCVTGGLTVLQEVCLCYRRSVCVTGGLSVLQVVCLCYRRSVCVTGGLSVLQEVCVTGGLFVLQVVCLCYRRSVCVTGGLSVLQEVCLCYRRSVCVTGGLSVLQEVCVTGGLFVLQVVCLCYRRSVCVTCGLSVLQEVCVTGGLFVLHVVCLCYRRSVCVTGGLFVLQVVCLCYRRSVCVTGGLTVLQEVCLCYRWSVCVTGGLFVGLPDEIPRSSMLTEADLQYYVSQYKERGFRGPLNWYRNGDVNWRWMCSRPTAKLLMPALMVTAGKDQVLLPAFSKGMEDMIPKLSRGHIEECGHWTQMDRPEETNKILISWLKDTHKKEGGVSVSPKL
ncbi:bifunctional epoxide hydrolase 2 [Pagrus major]|uniref:bifunctional epoxide hydrolase 2 n=1 Tax=Pagrus major TaxID=143350 RepID=UPI003CC859A6